MHPLTLRLPLKMLPQPDETTCGPTCLDAIYRYWGQDSQLAQIIERTHKMEFGGTFAVFLACDALRQGYQASIYTYNLTVFDPTWFAPGVNIAERLQHQRDVKQDTRLQNATAGYLEFLQLGELKGAASHLFFNENGIHGYTSTSSPCFSTTRNSLSAMHQSVRSAVVITTPSGRCPTLTNMVQPSLLKGACWLRCGFRSQVPAG
jgi:hypothetical protein